MRQQHASTVQLPWRLFSALVFLAVLPFSAPTADEIDGRSLDLVEARFAADIAGVAAPPGFQFLSLDLRYANGAATAAEGVAPGTQCTIMEDDLFPYFAEQVTGPVDQSALWQPMRIGPQEGIEATLVFVVPEQVGALHVACEIAGANFALSISGDAPATVEPSDEPIAQPAPTPENPPRQAAPVIATDAAQYEPGDTITASVSGLPGNTQDWLTLVASDAAADSFGEWSYTNGVTDGAFTFTAPGAPGAYEIRVYFDYPNGGYEIQASLAVTVALPEAEAETELEPEPEPQGPTTTLSVSAPEFAPGTRVTVSFAVSESLPADAWIGLVPSDTPHGDAAANDLSALDYRFLGGQTAGELPFFAPDAPGAYELRLFASRTDGAELASAAFAVVATEPEPVPEPPAIEPTLVLSTTAAEPGDPVEVGFTAPAAWPPQAAVVLLPVGNDTAVIEQLPLNGATEGTVVLTAPEAGDYEVRLVDGSGGSFAAVSLSVTAPAEVPTSFDITLSIDRDTFRPGQPIVASFEGLPGNTNDWLTLVAADAPDDAYTEWYYTEGAVAGAMTFSAPEPGDYEIRVLLAGSSNVVSARIPVVVEGPPEPPTPARTPGLTLAQAVYAPGEPIIVGFSAPSEFPDQAWIALMPADRPHGSEALNDGNYLDWRYINADRAGQLTFTAPTEPGRYDFRLHDGDGPGALEVTSIAFDVSTDGTPIAHDERPQSGLVTPDSAVNVASAPYGAVVYGATRAEVANDGNAARYDNNEGYAYASVGTPIILDLGVTYPVERLRLLLWDGDDRFYRYRIDGSADGTAWSVLEDRSSGEHRGWQEIALADVPLRYIRVVGLHNSTGPDLHIVELEAYSRGPVPFGTLAEIVADAEVPLDRDLALSLLGGVLEEAPAGTGDPEALIDGLAGSAAWAADPPTARSEFVISFNGAQPALIEAVVLRASQGEENTRPHIVEIAAETGGVLSPWRTIGRYGLHDGNDWQRLPFPAVEAARIRITILGTYQDDRPMALDEIVVLEATAEGYQSILPGQYPGFAGGPNIALAALGGRIERTSPTQDQFDPAALNDGLLGQQGSWGWYTADGAMPKEVVVSFRGGREAMIGGVSLNADSGFNSWHTLDSAVRMFEIWVSRTGPDSGFERVGGFLMDKAVGWQTFSFEPVPARYVMLRILQNHGAEEVSIGELEVLEAVEPNTRSILADDPPNIVLPTLGGHYAVPHGNNRLALIDGIADNGAWTMEDGFEPPVDLVLAFRDQRLATIDSLTVTPSGQFAPEDWVREIKVSVSRTSPVAGFETIGTYAIAPEQQPQTFTFPPVEARFVQVRVLSNGGGRHYALDGLAIHERLEPGQLSVLSRLPSDSLALPPSEPTPSLPDEPEPNDAIADATPIAPGESRDGLIAPPTDVDLYRLDTSAEPYPGITVTVTESPVLRVRLELLDRNGQPLAEQALYEQVGDQATLSWLVPQGVYYLRVSRPLTSIAVQSDLSPSTDPVRNDITRALNAFVGEMTEFERVGIAGFCGDIYQAVDFTSDPAALTAAVEEINFGCGGTALYGAMLTSLDWLAPQEGGRAILLITDAEDSGGHGQYLHEIWDRLGDAGVRVYGIGYGDAIRYQIGDGALGSTGADLLRSWAAATGGRYFDAPSGDAINEVAARIAEELRRPSLYRIAVSTPQGEGGLSVVEVGESIAGISAPSRVSLIFDASGSMWGRDDAGTPKIDIARQVMRAVILGMPEQIQVGLRIYGHRYPRDPKPRSCTDTELVVPFGPLDRNRLIGAIDALNPQGQTPIGLSLASLRQDFAGIEGQKVVILVTDGIETCDPDPGDPNYPPTVIQQLLAEGLEVKVNVVGFDIDESQTREFLRQISDLSGGQYFDAADATQLQAALEEAIRADFTVADARGEIVATGQVNDPPLMLVEGVYDVAVAADPPIVAEAVIAIDEETRILLNKEGTAVGIEVETRDLALAALEPTPPATPDGPTDTPVLPPAATLDVRSLVQEIQQRLIAQGFDPGPADGIPGTGTRDAIRAYQQQNGLPVDGLATAALLEYLRASGSTVSIPAPADGTFGAGSTFGAGDEPGPSPGQDGSSTITSASPVDRVTYFDSPLIMYADQAASRIRSGPDTSYDQVGSIPFAGPVTVLGELDGWYYLETANGVRGFTAGSLLSTTRPTLSSGRTPPGNPAPPSTPSPPTQPGPAAQPTCPPGETLIQTGPGRFICARLQ